jgi:tripartite-type tricarboxylate transporter receptor subunit TctC
VGIDHAGAGADLSERAVKIIVPQPPGGGFDTGARVLADRLSPLLGQPPLVENRPGAGTLVGTEAAAKAPPDGYTLLLGALSNIALNPGLYDKLSYDPLRDFVPIGLAVTWSYTLLARKDLPHKDLNELVAFARANPEQITYASAGRGSGQHIAMAVTAQLADIKLAQAAYQDVLGGRVDLFFDISSTARAQVDAGSVRALAVSSAEPQPMHPEVPSIAETGMAALDMESWFGLSRLRPCPRQRWRDYAPSWPWSSPTQSWPRCLPRPAAGCSPCRRPRPRRCSSATWSAGPS